MIFGQTAVHSSSMKPVKFWFWMLADETGKRRKSVCRLTEEDARRRDPQASPIPESLEVRMCPEDGDVWQTNPLTAEQRASLAARRGQADS